MKRISNYLQFIKFVVENKPDYHAITIMCKYQGIILKEEYEISKSCCVNRDRDTFDVYFTDSKNSKQVVVKWLSRNGEGERKYDYENFQIVDI